MSAQRKPGAKPTVPIEWRKDSAFVIASEEFKYADPTESIIREALAAGRLEAALEEILEERADAIRAEAINRILGINGSDVAKKFGITKQAVQQGVDRFCKEVGLRKTRAMRDEDAREKMSNSNYRPNAIGGVPEFEKGEDVES
jgi:hypothetical protein